MHISLCRDAVSASSLPDVRARGLKFVMQDFTCSATDGLSCGTGFGAMQLASEPTGVPPQTELGANHVLLLLCFAERDVENVVKR